jgi:DNA-binding NtrC family response regulator
LTTAVDGEPFIVAPYVASEQSFEVREIHDGVYATSGAPVTRIDVLALEDDLVFGSILKRFFEREGLDARIVTSIRDLQDLLNSGVRPSVVVSDIHLDQESGLDMLSILPKPAPPVVMLTSDASFDTELAAIQRGARAFLSKDRDPRLLAAYVKSIACECNEVSL